MKPGEASRYLGYLGYDAPTTQRAATRHLPSKKCLVAAAVLCVLILTALVIHAARPNESSVAAPQMDHKSSMDETTVVHLDAGDDSPNADQSTPLLPKLPHPECYGRWYPIFAEIREGLLAVSAE